MSGQRYRPQRRAELSQHFLRSRALAASLVAHSTISRQDIVVEIGPGRGALTRELARRCRQLIGVELDLTLLRDLQTEFRAASHVELVNEDFLRFPLPATLYKVFANVPFNQTAAIIGKLVEAPSPPQEAYLIVRRQDAERYVGGPYAPESRSSLLLKPWWHVEVLRLLHTGPISNPRPRSTPSCSGWPGASRRSSKPGSRPCITILWRRLSAAGGRCVSAFAGR